MPTFPFPETAAIITWTVSGTDARGDDVKTPVETTTTGAFAPAGSVEIVQGQNTVIDHDTFYLSDGAATPAPTDQIRVRGVVYNIDGKPQAFHNPFTGSEPGAVLRLERVTG